ncbi:MAG: GNAT family N-acetyltransferase [Polyangiaceae bacterium]
MDERLALLERYPYWPHPPRGASRAAIARFALGLLEGSEYVDERAPDGSLSASAARQRLAWDTEKLGLASARVAFIVDPASSMDRDAFTARAVADARDAGIGYLFTRIDAAELPQVQACEKAGFVTVDAILSQYLEVAHAPRVEVATGITIREATASDAALMSDLVDATLSHSRFHADPKVGPARGRELYREWGANSVRGLNELTLLAEVDGTPVGFLSVKDNKAARPAFGWGYGRIELVGVLERARGRGVVTALTAALIEVSPRFGWERLGIGTQISNVPAIRAYQKAGFVPGDAIFSMRWRVDDAR